MKVQVGAVVLAGTLAMAAGAQQAQEVPDAQVESNVLRALAGAPELSTQNIKTTTVYGVVTLSGSANDEVSRTKAEQLASRAAGVKKVVDELTLGAPDAGAQANSPDTAGNGADHSGALVLQSDGTYAPAGQAPQQQGQQTPEQQANSASPYPADANGQAGAPPPYPYPQQPNGAGYPPQQANGAAYPPQQQPNGAGYPQRRPVYNNGAAYAPTAPVPGGQLPGVQVTVPSGSLLRVRINQGLSTKRTQPGSTFDGTVLSDVTADGAVAIPRGAQVQGTVIESKDAGVLKGRGELALQLTGLTMGGQRYTLVSDTWQRDGKDKSLRTINSAIGLGALGALIGAGAGGGEGAAIGAGVGAAAGVGSSAASAGGKVIIPPEAVLAFHLAQPAQVATVSEQEMSRLSYAAGPGQAQPVAPRRAYYGAPYGPGPYYYGR